MHKYLNKFINLSRYAIYDVSTKERKIYRFLGGLNHTLHCQLSALVFRDFQTLIDKALIIERENMSAYEDKKQRFEYKKDTRDSGAQKLRTWHPALANCAPKPTWGTKKPDANNQNNSTKDSLMSMCHARYNKLTVLHSWFTLYDITSIIPWYAKDQ